jgi:hypothetical protein
MHSPSAGEAPLPTSSQPDTATAALQRIQDYIDSQLTDLVGMAVERAVGASYNKLADSVNKEIVSIRNQVFHSPQDEDDPMSQVHQNDNPADGDDESEDHRQPRQHRQNQRRNNRYNRQQKADNDEVEESDNGAIHGRRKTPIIFSVHDHLLRSHLNLLTQT